MNDDERFMRMALAEAREAYRAGEIPIGAVVVCKGRVIGRGHNLTESLCDVTAHAEMQAITAASQALGGEVPHRLHTLRDGGTLPDVRRRHRVGTDSANSHRCARHQTGLYHICGTQAVPSACHPRRGRPCRRMRRTDAGFFSGAQINRCGNVAQTTFFLIMVNFICKISLKIINSFSEYSQVMIHAKF